VSRGPRGWGTEMWEKRSKKCTRSRKREDENGIPNMAGDIRKKITQCCKYLATKKKEKVGANINGV